MLDFLLFLDITYISLNMYWEYISFQQVLHTCQTQFKGQTVLSHFSLSRRNESPLFMSISWDSWKANDLKWQKISCNIKTLSSNSLSLSIYIYIYIYIYLHQVVMIAESFYFSHHPFLFSITLERSCELQTLSALSCWI